LIRFKLLFISSCLFVLAQATPIKIIKGGTITDGLQVSNIRIGVHQNFTRIVFDVDFWEGAENYHTKKPSNTGFHIIKIDKNHHILIELSGYRANKVDTIDIPKYTNITSINVLKGEEYADDSSIFYSIQLKHNANIKVFSLLNPTRLVVDIGSSL